MSTLKVNYITNSGAAVNFPANLKVGAGYAGREYYDQTTKPTGVSEGAIWWNDSDETLNMYIDGGWYTITQVPVPPVWYGDRGLFGGGSSSTNVIEYITISVTGNPTDFGDLTVGRFGLGACSNGTRGVFGGGYSSSFVNTIDYVTIATTGNAVDFGDLTLGRGNLAGASNGTYGLFGGGSYIPGSTLDSNVIDYVTIDTTGNATDFGDLTVSRNQLGACSSETRAVWGGGWNDGGTYFNNLDYVTVATTSNATDFGDLLAVVKGISACSDNTYGVFGGGSDGGGLKNVIQYITIATTGNATDFGDLTEARERLSSTSNLTRGIFGGGNNRNNIDYITIATPGNATDFGDLTTTRGDLAACSGD